jgi:hypothetical protein
MSVLSLYPVACNDISRARDLYREFDDSVICDHQFHYGDCPAGCQEPVNEVRNRSDALRSALRWGRLELAFKFACESRHHQSMTTLCKNLGLYKEARLHRQRALDCAFDAGAYSVNESCDPMMSIMSADPLEDIVKWGQVAAEHF